MSEQQSQANNSEGMSRRQFLGNSLKTACSVGLFGLGLGLFARQSYSLPSQAVRPPGALDEKTFLGACVRCGLCVRDCPYDTLRLAEVGEDVALGTPYFVAREIACRMCEDIPCVAACPTGALDKSLEVIEDARMGLAVIIDQENCIAFQGLRCEVCYNVCPVKGKAITLETRQNVRTGRHAMFIPVVHSNACTGCGLCEEACILEEAAVKVFPIHLAKGELGRHYRLGWEEKEKAGGSLVAPDKDRHQFNLPEGYRYDYGGQGLIREEEQEEPKEKADNDSPFSGSALERLNRGIQ